MVRTVREELAEHEGVVGLGVVLGQRDVLVHVEGHDMFEPARRVALASPQLFPYQDTHESFSSLTSLMRAL